MTWSLLRGCGRFKGYSCLVACNWLITGKLLEYDSNLRVGLKVVDCLELEMAGAG